MSNIVRLTVALMPDPAPGQQPQKAVSESDFLRLQCINYGEGNPKPIYSWSTVNSVTDKNPRLVQTNTNRITIDPDGSLLISNVEKSDQSLYKCNMRNHILDAEKGGSYTNVVVSDPPGDAGRPEQRPPTLLYPPTSISSILALKGQEASLQCFFSGYPTPNRLTWERIGGTLPINSHTTDVHYLTFTNVKYENEGSYDCYPEGFKNVRRTLQLRVESKPEWVQRPVDANVTEGNNHTFYCEGEGRPAVTTTWFINGKIVDNQNPRPGVTMDPAMRYMNVTNVARTRSLAPGDHMNVQCQISNKHGSDITGGYLNVIKETTITAGPQTITLVQNQPVIFNCEAQSDPSTPVTVRWRHGGRDIVLKDGEIMQLPNNSLCIITKEKPRYGREYVGVFECEATNGYSSATASARLLSPTTADPKKGDLSDLWWVFLIIALLLLLLLLIFCCCLYCRRNQEYVYPVDEKERQHGNDPEKDLADDAYRDYQRPELPVKDTLSRRKDSKGSLNISLISASEEGASLMEYGDLNASRFNEDGSFIGHYADQRSTAGSYAYYDQSLPRYSEGSLRQTRPNQDSYAYYDQSLPRYSEGTLKGGRFLSQSEVLE